MAIITWQGVTAPDFSGSQLGLRTASELFNKVLDNSRGITQDLGAMDATQKVADQQLTERLLTQETMQAKTPEELQQLTASGLMGKVPQQTVTPELMRARDARGDVLQGRLDAATQRDQLKLDRDWTKHTRDRQANIEVMGDKAAPFFDQFAPIARTDPALATQKLVQTLSAQGINLTLEQAQKITKDYHDLYFDKSNLIHANAAARKQNMDEFQIKLDDLVNQYVDKTKRETAGAGPDIQNIMNSIKDTKINGIPVSAATIRLRYADKMNAKENPNFMAENYSTTGSLGMPIPVSTDGGLDVQGITDLITQKEHKLDRNLSNWATLYKEFDGNYGDIDSAASMLGAEYQKWNKDKPVNVGEMKKVISKIVAKGIPANVAAKLASTFATDERLWNLENFADGFDIEQAKLDNQVKDMKGYEIEYDNYKQNKAAFAQLATYRDKYDALKTQQGIYEAAASNPNAPDNEKRKTRALQIKNEMARIDSKIKDLVKQNPAFAQESPNPGADLINSARPTEMPKSTVTESKLRWALDHPNDPEAQTYLRGMSGGY